MLSLVSEHTFLHVICRDDDMMKTVCHSSDRTLTGGPLCREIPPPPPHPHFPVQVKEPQKFKMVTKWLLVGLHPANWICLECPRGGMAVYREKKQKHFLLKNCNLKAELQDFFFFFLCFCCLNGIYEILLAGLLGNFIVLIWSC